MQLSNEELLKSFTANRIAGYQHTSVLTLFLCDIVATLPREIQYIWRSPGWSTAKTFYLIVRYWTLITLSVQTAQITTIQTSLLRCKIFLGFQNTVGSTIFIGSMFSLISVRRVRGLYMRNRKAQLALHALDACTILIFLYVNIVLNYQTVNTAFLDPRLMLGGCLATMDTTYLVPPWIISALMGIVVFSMTAWWYISRFQEYRLDKRLPPMLNCIIRDGTLYFVFNLVTIIAVLIFCLKKFLSSHWNAFSLCSPWLTAIISYSASRLILHLREAGDSDSNWFAYSVFTVEPGAQSTAVSQEIAFA